MKNNYDVRLNIDLIIGIQSDSQEEAYHDVEDLNTRELLTIALEQLPFIDIDSTSINLCGHDFLILWRFYNERKFFKER